MSQSPFDCTVNPTLACAPSDHPDLTAIVLAGGQSRRMGADKAQLLIAGVPLLQRVCEAALACTPDVRVVTPHPHRYRAIAPSPCQFIVEQSLPSQGRNPSGSRSSSADSTQSAPPDRPPGPLVGFSQGLATVERSWVLLLACDLPWLDSALLKTWIATLPAVPPTAIAALIPATAPRKHQWEPFCGFYRRTAAPSVAQFIAQGGRSFQSWLAIASVHPLPIPPQLRSQVDHMLTNCNTPADVKACHQPDPARSPGL